MHDNDFEFLFFFFLKSFSFNGKIHISVLFYFLDCAKGHMDLNSPNRDRTHAPAVEA